MGKSLYLGTYAGIPVFLHWTFGFIVLIIAYLAYANAMSVEAVLWLFTYILSIFICVIFHEYGHAIAGKKYGVKTRDIIIAPIGGVARMESMPENPWKELIIAIAGPIVNVVLAVFFYILFKFIFPGQIIFSDNLLTEPKDFESYMRLLIILNVVLFAFNLIPAFPMDGGRILRSLLAVKMGRLKATNIAAWIGRLLSLILIIIGVWLLVPMWAFIGIFVFYMAHMENKQVKTQYRLKSTYLSELMEVNFPRIRQEETLAKVIKFYRSKVAQNFLIFSENDEVVGVVPEIYIQNFLKDATDFDIQLNELMSKSFGFFKDSDHLEYVFNVMNENGWSIAGIKNGDQLIGIVDRHIINSFLSNQD